MPLNGADYTYAGEAPEPVSLDGVNVKFDGNGLVRGEKRVVGSFAYTPADFTVALGLALRLPQPPPESATRFNGGSGSPPAGPIVASAPVSAR